MSVDALTLTAVRNREDVWGRTRTNLFDVTLSSGYPTGGYTMAPHRVGFTTLQGIVLEGGSTASISYLPFFNTTTGKLQIVDNTSGTEESDNTDLDAITLRLRFEGE